MIQSITRIILIILTVVILGIWLVIDVRKILQKCDQYQTINIVNDGQDHQQVIRIPIEDRVDLNIDDQHNVHNVCLRRALVQVIKVLQDSDQRRYTVVSAINMIYNEIKSNAYHDHQTRQLAARALEQIDQVNAYYHKANIYEKELLRLVWERIQHPINSDRHESLVNNLINQLADCLNGPLDLHCCEGRIMRIIQTLECVDMENIVNLRPMWAYREEISNILLRYRNKLLKQSPVIYQQLDQKPTLSDSERQLMNRFNRCLIRNLNERYYRDYVNTGILTLEELNDLTRVYYDSLYDF